MNEPMRVDLPPGFFGNGTPYSAAGRYADGNLVRFVNGFARPIGGWKRRTDISGVPIPPLFDPVIEAARASIGWTDTAAGGRHMVVGTNAGLYEISPSGVVTDITPAGFVPGLKDPAARVGYGTGPYGRESFGTPRTGAGAEEEQVANWSFSLFGGILLAAFRNDGPLYKWQDTVDTVAVAVPNAPVGAQGVLVTGERIVMTIKRQPRLVEWSASEDFNEWTPEITNTAGSQVLAGSGNLQAIVQVGREILILSTDDAWVGRYIGAPFIYGFEPLGQNCGCLAPNSVAVVAGRAVWLGRGGFWTYDGTVRKLDSDIDDYIREDVSGPTISKMCALEYPSFREVCWFYQSQVGTECDSYLTLNYVENHWTWGRLDRTTGIPPGVSQTPVLVGADGALYNHELAGVAVPADKVCFLETGPLELGSGGRQMAVQYVFPDLTPTGITATYGAQPNADTGATVTILGKDWPSPNEPERAYGPYPLDKPTPTTGARGREIRLRYTGKTAKWRVGRNRIVAVPMGGR